MGYLYTIGNPRTDWCYRIEPDPGLNGRTIGYARGRVLGGCSSINAMIYMRGQRSDYDHWASLGNRGWGWDDVLPVFKRSEDYQHGADECHGVGGEMRVEERRVSWEIRRGRPRTSSGTCSRCPSTSSATRCTSSTRSRRRSPTCSRRAAGTRSSSRRSTDDPCRLLITPDGWSPSPA